MNAAQDEGAFVGAFEAHARASSRVVDPEDGGSYELASGEFRSGDRLAELVEALKARGEFSRETVARFPLGRFVSLRLRRRFSRREILLVAASLARFEDWIVAGAPPSPPAPPQPLGTEDLDRFLGSCSASPAMTAAYYGLFSASGWRAGILRGREQAARICLVAPEPEGTWHVEHNLPREVQEYRWFFDPEGKEGRVGRLVRAAQGMPELKIAGGFVSLPALSAAFGEADPAVLDLVIERVLAADRRLSVVEVQGVSIVKRVRI